ncbi:TPA: mechanosensitive ion channel [Legionella pneumophila]|uniref:Potassium efflux system KefA n=2 Tax=Legionella pneumophila TaxID=446 RepID=Q5ZVG1_LEGPH|nr:mechanosensitive ion channel domain-containing protein [Legionella pneumophila]WBV64446.1 mechanosensitive ion channel [Legionella pneumophila 130b]AAU27561.1 potassium efflux system KefA [Legionella pneumophila subsp. pneumophila str. Philadelphia 1]AGN14369.1 potassium efflux system protein KefA [Legionella pneumophila subsp. pneumophila str. Thunder Bay]AOU04488.1 mechanosensitive ion channel protein MscS [Legionella pneumophila]AOU07452.1 mechanosensitive ion channel protein MscS [Legio
MRQLLRQSNLNLSTTSFKYLWCFFLPLFLLFFSFSLFSASVKENNATLVEYLAHEKTHLTIAINEIKQKSAPKDEQEYNEKLRQIRTILSMNKAKIESLNSFSENQKKEEVNLNDQLKRLQQMPLANAEVTIQEKVGKIETLLTVNKKTTELIAETLDLAKQYQLLLNDVLNELKLWKANFDLKEKLKSIKAIRAKLNKELNILYENAVSSQDKKQPELTISEQIQYEANLYINNQRIAVIHQKLNALELQKKIIKTNILLLNNLDTKALQSAIDNYREVINQYSAIESSLQTILNSLTNQANLFVEPGLQKSVSLLQNDVKTELKETSNQKLILSKNLEDYQNQLKKQISTRQSLSEYNIDSWAVILNKLIDIPNLFYKYIKTLTIKVYDSYTWLDTFPAIFLWTVLIFILSLFYILNHVLKTLARDKERSRFTGYLYGGILVLLQRNIPHLCFFAMLSFILYFTSISYANSQLLIKLIIVWLTFRVLILIARLILLESISDSSGKDVKLYYRLKWLLLFGGWTTALMTFSHLLPLSILLQDIFNRLFMLFMLTVSLVAWKSKDVIPYLIRPLLKSKKRYFKNAISLLVILVPITLFTTAIIGLIGFVNLAWTMSRYQAYILLVLVGYILVRGLIFDALELFSEWMISSLKNGWLWIEVFLKPIDKILRIVLFLTSVLILFQLFGWYSDSLVVTSLEKVVQYSILNITGIHITVASIIEFLILLAVLVWAAKWTREFCFRWLYKNTKDVGIRHSLSVFTQYAIILLGTFITLHVLGLDFSGMSMILGGLAVGMGFGLRDFASNIVGGIMLLIERPVREGDLITIGEYEGQVAHIGIRSMRVSSWDNTQVLIPNAETFNKPFTNWTHQDGIIRTVIPIKVSRADDPVMIQQLILDVLAIIPEIVPDPPAQVFLKKIDTALIEFEARYFINIQNHNRVEVRSKVLFAITAQFKAAGIQPPIEPITVELKESSSVSLKKQTTEE